MSKWEYTTIQVGSHVREFSPKLTQMGDKGWELVSVVTFGEPQLIPNVYYTWFFKRRVGGISPDDIQVAKECLRDAGIIDMTRRTS